MAIRSSPGILKCNGTVRRRYSIVLSLGALAVLMVACGGGGSGSDPVASTAACGGAVTQGGAPGSPNSATLTWDAVTHPELCGYRIHYAVDPAKATEYRVERCQGAGCVNFVTVATLGGTTYNDTSLAEATSYSYRVRAADATGKLSEYSNIASDTTPAALAAPGLMAAYAFNEGTGSTVADASGNNNMGAISGATWTTSGRFENALVFDGTSAQVTVANSASLGLTTAMTLEAWVFPTATPTGWRAVIVKNDNGYYLLASSVPGNSPAMGGTWTAGQSTTAAPAVLAVNAWTHLAVTFDGAMVLLYVNGVQVESRSENTSLVPTGGTLQIGADISGEFFSGRIDDVRIYNRALSVAEIQTDMTTAIVSDTSAPSTPAGLAATGANSAQIDLAWSVSSDNVGVTNYRIERCTGAGCVNFVQVATSTGATYNDISGLVANTSYRYQVRAADATGNLSGYSNILAANTLALVPDTSVPTTPAGLTGTGVSGAQINLAWSVSSDNLGVSNYRVERCTGVGCVNFVQLAMPSGTTYSDATGLVANTSYRYRVRAVDAAGNLSEYSDIAAVNTLPPDSVAPSAPGLTAVAANSAQINLTWGIPTLPISYFQSFGKSIPVGNVTSYTLAGLGGGKRYYFAVTALDASNNESLFSNVVFKDIP